MSFFRTCAATVLLVPTLTVFAADKNPGVTPALLVNQTIPTYGVVNQVPHYTDSRANGLYLEIHQVLADVESHVMSTKSSKAMPIDNSKSYKIDAKKAAEAGIVIPPPPAIGDARLSGLLDRLVELDAAITYRTYLEQWQLDNSFANLSRAAQLQALSGYVTPEKAAEIENARIEALKAAALASQDAETRAKAEKAAAKAQAAADAKAKKEADAAAKAAAKAEAEAAAKAKKEADAAAKAQAAADAKAKKEADAAAKAQAAADAKAKKEADAAAKAQAAKDAEAPPAEPPAAEPPAAEPPAAEPPAAEPPEVEAPPEL